MQTTGLDLFFWVAGLLGHLCLLLVLFGRHLARRFPVFTTLIVCNVVRTLVLYGVSSLGSPVQYFYNYWVLAVLDALLQIGVVFELAAHIFRPVGVWAPDLRRRTLWIPAVCVFAAILLTWLATPSSVSLQQSVVIRGTFFSSALMSELFLGVSALSLHMGLPWETPVARIAQGFGVFSISGILLDGLNTFSGVASGTHTYNLLTHLRIALYLVCVGYWIVMLARKAPQPKEMSEVLQHQLYQLQLKLALDLRLLRDRKS